MKTLEEIRKETEDYMWTTFECTMSVAVGTGKFRLIYRLINEFAINVAKEALKNASENAKTTQTHSSDGIFDVYKTIVDKQSILNESNIPKL